MIQEAEIITKILTKLEKKYCQNINYIIDYL